MKEYAKIWQGWLESIEQIPAEQVRAEMALAIFRYALRSIKYEGNDPYIRILMPIVMKSVDRSDVCAESGQKGGLQRVSNSDASSDASSGASSGASSHNININIKTKDKRQNINTDIKNTTPNGDSTKKTKRQKKILPIPTIEEVAEYIKTKGYNLDARAFWSHYDARDWMRNGKVIENWHAQIATWVKNQPLYDNRPQPQGATFDEAERARLLAAIEQDKAKARVVQQQRDREQWEREERERIARLNELTGYDYQPENYDYYERRDD